MMLDQRCWCVVPAAGVGSRLGAACPKQYVSIGGKPILEHTLSALLSCTEFEKVVVVLGKSDLNWNTVPSATDQRIMTAQGGETRAHSVLNGLDKLAGVAKEDDWVLVHDAARPCVTVEQLAPLFSAVIGHSVGGLLGMPVVDTVKHVSFQGEVESTLPREHIWLAQTPQIFRYALLKRALSDAIEEGVIITDEASAIELAEHKPKMVLGSKDNIKVTHWEDLQRAEKILGGGVCA